MEGDIKACFDEISHPALMDRVRSRIGDKRVLALVKAFLKSGILGEDRELEDDHRRNPARVDLVSAADQRGAVGAGRAHRPGSGRAGAARKLERRTASAPRSAELPAGPVRRRLVPDGQGHQGRRRGAARTRSPAVLATMGLRLSPEKTLITHIDEGLDFLGWRIQRHRKRGTSRHYVYTYPSKKAVLAVMAEGEDDMPTGRGEPAAGRPAAPAQPGAAGLVRLLPARRVVRDVFSYLSHYVWRTVWRWLRRKHRRERPGSELRRQLLRRRMVAGQRAPGAVRPGEGEHDPIPLPGIGDPVTLASDRR